MNTITLSIVIGIAGMIGWGVYDFLGGVFSRQMGSFKSLLWSQLAGFLFIFLLALFFTTSIRVPGPVIVLSPIAAILYSAGYLFFFKGFERGNVSIIAATMNLWAVFTMLFAFLFMGQRLTAMQSSGVFMIISGAALASLNWREIRDQRFQISSGVKEAVLGALFFGVFWNISEIISEQAGWLITTLSVKFGIVLVLLIFSLPAKQEIGLGKTSPKTKYIILFMGMIEAGAVALVNFGLTIGDAILITPIASALSIVTISLAMIFLKERVTKIQAAGMIAAVAGIIMTAF